MSEREDSMESIYVKVETVSGETFVIDTDHDSLDADTRISEHWTKLIKNDTPIGLLHKGVMTFNPDNVIGVRVERVES